MMRMIYQRGLKLRDAKGRAREGRFNERVRNRQNLTPLNDAYQVINES